MIYRRFCSPTLDPTSGAIPGTPCHRWVAEKPRGEFRLEPGTILFAAQGVVALPVQLTCTVWVGQADRRRNRPCQSGPALGCHGLMHASSEISVGGKLHWSLRAQQGIMTAALYSVVPGVPGVEITSAMARNGSCDIVAG